jgi:hypothetical protein
MLGLMLASSTQCLSKDDLPQLNCIPITEAGFVITKPGRYCMASDIDTRLDFADHSAEAAIAIIRSSDVVVDMQGHRGGRGRFFVQTGGNGFSIEPDFGSAGLRNILIENGVLSDCLVGIYLYNSRYQMPTTRRQLMQLGENDFLYEPSNIRIRNVVFKRCPEKFSFWDWIPEQ